MPSKITNNAHPVTLNKGEQSDEASALLMVPSDDTYTSTYKNSQKGDCASLRPQKQHQCTKTTTVLCFGLCTALWLSSWPFSSGTPTLSVGFLSFGTAHLEASNESASANDPQSSDTCDELLLGVWMETCFMASYHDTIPGPEGVSTHPVIITAAGPPARGFNLHAFSQNETFFGGADYVAIGHGQPSHVLPQHRRKIVSVSSVSRWFCCPTVGEKRKECSIGM